MRDVNTAGFYHQYVAIHMWQNQMGKQKGFHSGILAAGVYVFNKEFSVQSPWKVLSYRDKGKNKNVSAGTQTTECVFISQKWIKATTKITVPLWSYDGVAGCEPCKLNAHA